MDQPKQESNPQIHPLEAVAGWLVPGLGHLLLGQRARGLIIMVSIGALWLGGLLIGGIGVIDHFTPDKQGQTVTLTFSWWFAGQALIGPSLGVDWFNQEINRANRSRVPVEYYRDPEEHPLVHPSLGHVNEQGTLYTALAGMLNLLAILDVAYCDAQERRRGRNRGVPGKEMPGPGAPVMGGVKGGGA